MPTMTSLAPQAEQQVLLFKLGGHSLGIPLNQVRYVASIPANFRFTGPHAADHFVFEGEPLTYISLWQELGLPSAYAEYETLQEMLPQRRQDHLDWMSALEESIHTGSPFSKARHARDCAFGKWFYAYRPQDRRLSLLLGQFEHPHVKIHALADSLLGLSEQGQRPAAIAAFQEARATTLAHLLELFEAAQQLVIELQRRIAVIVADGTDTCALGADSIQDIVSVPAEQIRPPKTSGSTRQVTAGLIILDDRQVVPLLDWKIFRNLS